mmetsp:Transcript_25942/g.29880  ORF Transcript_25942/g.29880 Transcript_25942/m.29880 type:complete len:231 (+) Transcript_25942:100-792(+)|eukprot:CAMPEP_0194374504 /NCGR_PEP_ID=MMETSP0174-20130528/22923_1 /TAXON_ID=216777 /ORGANISM="Proboscia alata, Strain PI-D3" /LENGTH=230 /DNA_ID=CAMNT_0039154107 /DNA_START=167 /DNA_END=859 /DNA_ORIENTATION=-
MPRLGIDGNNDEPLRSGSRGNPAAAYPPNARARSMWSMLLILFFTLVLRNLFFRDYRSEEVSYLKASGKSDEEIAQVIPRSRKEYQETQAKELSEYEQMKKDVGTLKTEVKDLRAKVYGEAYIADSTNQIMAQENSIDADEQTSKLRKDVDKLSKDLKLVKKNLRDPAASASRKNQKEKHATPKKGKQHPKSSTSTIKEKGAEVGEKSTRRHQTVTSSRDESSITDSATV